ncbi:hypothetical protein Sant_3792 [Sodalis praecaptivus]|uniref:Uncharacterized protein n=2 Tax=Bruguierivoracaceae TaxID=2812006 RepID=W0HY26_9GAMM|nr:hypothetical protein Sant_3792 [Sodalis praecaptivus]
MHINSTLFKSENFFITQPYAATPMTSSGQVSFRNNIMYSPEFISNTPLNFYIRKQDVKNANMQINNLPSPTGITNGFNNIGQSVSSKQVNIIDNILTDQLTKEGPKEKDIFKTQWYETALGKNIAYKPDMAESDSQFLEEYTYKILVRLTNGRSSPPLPDLSSVVPNLDELIPVQGSQKGKELVNFDHAFSKRKLYYREKIADPDCPGKYVIRNTLYKRKKVPDPDKPGKLITLGTLYSRKKVPDPDDPGLLISQNKLYWRKLVPDPENPARLISRKRLFYRKNIPDPENRGGFISLSTLKLRKLIQDPDNPDRLIYRNTLYKRKSKINMMTRKSELPARRYICNEE